MEAKDLDEQQLRQARHHDARIRWCHLGLLERIGNIGARPVPVTAVNSYPAGAAGDDVEQDDAVGIWPEDLRCLPRGQRLVRPWLAVLGPKEYRTFQPQPLKRRLERSRQPALVRRGHTIRCAGVAVMAKRRTPHKTDRVMNKRRPPRPRERTKRWPYLWTSTRWTARCQPIRSPEL